VRRQFPPEHHEPQFEVANIIRRNGDAYRAQYSPSFEQGRALHAIETCRTTALGAHVDACDHCGHLEISYNSCRNRHCPRCRGSARGGWVDARELELLPIQYFHVVFTLPEALTRLAQYDPTEVYGILLRAAGETRQTFAHKGWGADLGVVAVLHTWGQTMNLHAHVDCLVTGGAFKRDGSGFVQAPKNFLLPHRALSLVLRAIVVRDLKRRRGQGRLGAGAPERAEDAAWMTPMCRLHRYPP
jgi:hypothetical protein